MPRSYDPLTSYGGGQMPTQQNTSPLLPRQVIGLRAQSQFATQIVQRNYPIGSIYVSTVATNPAEPQVLGFGTWAAFAPGQVLVGVDPSDVDFAEGVTGGEKTHVLTTPEMPAHSHTTTFGGADASGSSGLVLARLDAGNNQSKVTSSTGGGGAHNNLQPYVTVYIFKRTA